jgi:hypothetical protein
VDARAAERLRRCLDGALPAGVLPSAALEQLRAGPILRRRPHGSIAALTAASIDGPLARTVEIDPAGTLHAALAWSGTGLTAAWLRLPDQSWLRVEPHAAGAAAPAPGGGEAPWSAADRLWHCRRLGERGDPLTVLQAVDYGDVRSLPTLWDPARLPAGGGSALLNLLASLAEDQGRDRLVYEGPYPTEQLFLSLLESFRPLEVTADPLGDFAGGAFGWAPAPHERQWLADGVHVQRRGRIDKVVRGRRAYYRDEWWGIRRHAPRRVVDEGDEAVAGLWFLGECVERHVVIGPRDDAHVAVTLAAEGSTVVLPPAVVTGLAAVVAATGALPLAPLVPDLVADVAWGPAGGDLLDGSSGRLVFSSRMAEVLAARMARASRPERAALALAALREMAVLAAEIVQVRAQERLAGLPGAVQERLLNTPPPLPPDTATRITAAVEGLVEIGGTERRSPR